MSVQSELFEPAPTRRLIVPRGHESWWGVDVSTKAVSIGWVGRLPAGPQEPLQRGVVTVSWAPLDGGARLGAAHVAIVTELRGAVDAGRMPAPGFAFVEQPGQKNPNWPLAYMVGVAQAAVCCAADGVRCETVPPSSWKKRACGFGAIPKLDPETRKPWRDPFGYGVLRWAAEHGYGGTSWDESDAWGIAEAARRTVMLEPR